MIGGQTEAEYLRRSPDGQFCEFIDGIVYMPAAVHAKHQFDIQFLTTMISMFDADHPVGITLTGPAVLKLRENCFVEPDLFVLPPGAESQIQRIHSVLPARLVVEMLSSDRAHDLVRKLAEYRAAGIPEIWFVDNRDRTLIIERREGENYSTTKIKAGPVVSRSLPGFWFEASWLWATPRPNLRVCFDQILAGPPRG